MSERKRDGRRVYGAEAMQRNLVGENEPLMTFFSVFADAPAPRRADRSLLGSVPLRAYQHCEPLTSASAFGWYVYPPCDFLLKWDGTEIFWKPVDARKWAPATAAIFPGFADHYARAVPPKSSLQSPFPFLMARREVGLIQIWPGVLVRTRPGWSTLVRGPANLPRGPAYEVLEGVIESDWWFGPLISTLRLCQTGRSILFSVNRPLFQLQPVQSKLYAARELDHFRVKEGLASLSDDDWRRWEKTVNPHESHSGLYAAQVRRGRNSRQAGK
jgi:Family of unknown function (DUF6065)